MFLRIAPLAPATLPVLAPDIVWDARNQVGDLALGAAGGFQAANPIGSAVTIILMTDARCPPAMLKVGLGGDRRGWPGDGFDVRTAQGEAPLGTYWWAMRREVLSPALAQQFLAEGLRALQVLKQQQLCASITGQVAQLDIADGLLALAYQLFGVDGRELFAGQYRPLWQRTGGV
jgi:phage gp46-like protein